MELFQRDRLSELVEELTTSGQPQLNQDKMKEIKKICKYVTRDYSETEVASPMSYSLHLCHTGFITAPPPQHKQVLSLLIQNKIATD